MNAMMTNQVPGHLEVRWIPVTDAAGREHMEACWVSVDEVSSPAISHAA